MEYQQNNTSLIENAKIKKNFSMKHFYRANNKYSFIRRKHKIVMSKLLEK